MIKLNQASFLHCETLPNLARMMQRLGHDPTDKHVVLDNYMVALILNELCRQDDAMHYSMTKRF